MRLSTLFGRTLRDAPAEAEHLAHQLVVRAGLVRPLQAGSFAYLPLGMGVIRRLEAIMHQELAKIGAQEVRLPLIQSAVPWQQTGRYDVYGPLMLRATDRSGRSLIIAPTNEEAVAELARREIPSYRQMPAIIYQIQSKYRDELRTKGGLMRMREFTMLDAYSLDAGDAGLDASYNQVAAAFERIFERCGVRFVSVEASNGEMGGSESREYMALSASGEDLLAVCRQCGYAANVEVATSGAAALSQGTGTVAPVEAVETPNCATIADVAGFLGVPEQATAKAVFFDTPERGLVFVVIRGDLEVNEAKLRAIAGVSALAPASAEQIAAAGAVAGYASAVGLRVQGDGAERGDGVFVLADRSVAEGGPLVAGANRAGYHLRNVLYGRDWQATRVDDLAAVRAGDPCVRCGTALVIERGVEVGHVFKFGTRYGEALSTQFLDQQGTMQPVVMGSYGIGLDRLIQIIIEQHHDQAGIAWPAAVAPLDLHLVRLGKGDTVRDAADLLYQELLAAGMRVLYDDRDDSAGIKFNDADLIGLPLRLVISERLLASGELELKQRSGEAHKLPRAGIVEALQDMLGL